MGSILRMRKLWFIAGAIGLFTVLALLALTTVAYTEYAFICTNTGSRKGYDEWRTGVRFGEWTKVSPLEQFIGDNYPEELEHDWVSYAGTGRNVFSGKISHGHGRAGSILRLRPELFEEWFALLTDEEKFEVYSILRSGEEDKVWELVDDAYEKQLSRDEVGAN